MNTVEAVHQANASLLGFRSFPTGSRTIGGAEQYSDWDWVVLWEGSVEDLAHKLSKFMGTAVDFGGSELPDKRKSTSLKMCASSYKINYIVVHDMETYLQWYDATVMARMVDNDRKVTRVAMFDTVFKKRSFHDEAYKLKGQGTIASAVGGSTFGVTW